MIDLALLAAKTRAALMQRPFWQVRYADNTIVSEWERDWSLLKREGLVEGRLVCPNGDVATVGNVDGAGTRLFQFKTAVMLAGIGRSTDGYVIGIIVFHDGTCQCAAWEPDQGCLITFVDNVLNFAYRSVGPLGLDNLKLKLG